MTRPDPTAQPGIFRQENEPMTNPKTQDEIKEAALAAKLRRYAATYPDHPALATALEDSATALDSLIQAKEAAERRAGELEEGLSRAEAWLDRWAAHVGACRGGEVCTCGLTANRHEARSLLTGGES